MPVELANVYWLSLKIRLPGVHSVQSAGLSLKRMNTLEIKLYKKTGNIRFSCQHGIKID